MAGDTRARTPLSRDRILRAALALADEGGVEALTMRKLGQALGFEAMSLYNHVANKHDLIDGILDLVLDETDPPDGDGDWDAALRRSAVSVYRALRRHPWAAPLLVGAKHVRPARLRYMDALLGRLRGAGFSADTTYHAYHVLDAHIVGFPLWQAGHAAAPVAHADAHALFDRMIPASEYPHLREHGEQHLAEGPHRTVSAFEFGLDLILAGLRKVRAVEAAA